MFRCAQRFFATNACIPSSGGGAYVIQMLRERRIDVRFPVGLHPSSFQKQHSVTPQAKQRQQQRRRPCSTLKQSNTTGRGWRQAANRKKHRDAEGFQKMHFSTKLMPPGEEVKAEEVTVTSTTLFGELKRLFPWSTNYRVWRQNLAEGKDDAAHSCAAEEPTSALEVSDNGGDGGEGDCSSCGAKFGTSDSGSLEVSGDRQNLSRVLSSSGEITAWKASKSDHSSHTHAPHAFPRAGATSQRTFTAGYDWRRLFLVRYEPSSTVEPSAVASNAVQHTFTLNEEESEHPPQDAKRAVEKGSAFSEAPTCALTDEGRAVQLWMRLALSSGLENSSAFCWTQPATYTLYYCPSCCSPAVRTDPPSLSCANPLSAKARVKSGDRDAPAEKKTLDENRRHSAETATWRHSFSRVGMFHAIPGLPQPVPITLPATQLWNSVYGAQLFVGQNQGLREGVLEAMDAEVHEASTSVFLSGSVCSLHAFCTALCDAAAQSTTTTGVAAREMTGHAGLTSAAQHPAKLVARPPDASLPNAAAKQKPRRKVTPSSAVAPPTVIAAAAYKSSPVPSRFPLPIFFEREATQRSNSRPCSRDRWATERYADARRRHRSSCTSADRTENPCTGRIQRSASPPCSPSVLHQTESCAVVVQPLRPQPICADEFGAPHWNCVSSSAFLHEFAQLHFRCLCSEGCSDDEGEQASKSTRLNDLRSSADACVASNRSSFNNDSDGVAFCSAGQIVRDCGVGVLLVHAQEWVYFSLLLHAHPAVAYTHTGTRGGDTCSQLGGCSSQEEVRSESLSHHYCFLHAPCRMSVDEMAKWTREGTTALPLSDAAPLLVLPRTWLVHLSSDAQYHGVVDRLWKASGFGKCRGGQTGGDGDSGDLTAVTRTSLGLAEAPGDCSVCSAKEASQCYQSCHDDVNDDARLTYPAAAFRSEDGDDDQADDNDFVDKESQGEARCSRQVLAAMHQKRLRRACEVELLFRYLRHTASPSTSDTSPLHTSAPKPHSQHHESLLSVVTPHGGCSPLTHLGCSAVVSQQGNLISISPFPRSSTLLKNRSWFSRPSVLAEELKYGRVVKYRCAELAVPHVRQQLQ